MENQYFTISKIIKIVSVQILGVQISFEGLTKDGTPKKPSKLICTPNNF